MIRLISENYVSVFARHGIYRTIFAVSFCILLNLFIVWAHGRLRFLVFHEGGEGGRRRA